jgi:hypothetical protein
LERIRRAIRQHRPCYALSLRVVLAYGVSTIDAVSSAAPVRDSSVTPLQRAVDSAITAALLVPKQVPKVFLYAPLRHGGFGAPCLATRCALRYLQGVCRAATSRSSLVRHSILHLLDRPQLLPLASNDVHTFHTLCERWDLRLLRPPCGLLSPALPIIVTLRAYSGGPVLLVSDGSAPTGCLGWGAVVADSAGVLATAYAGVQCDVSYSYAAEWVGKLAAAHLAEHLGIPPRPPSAWLPQSQMMRRHPVAPPVPPPPK